MSTRIMAPAVLAGVALLVAACGSGNNGASNAASGGSGAVKPAPAAASTRVAHVKVKTASGKAGTFLTDSSGRSLYLWVADGKGSSSCMGACAQEWPPLIAKGKPVAGSGVKAAELGTIKRSDGKEQVTYKGHPLYTFVGDRSAGQTTGQGNDDFGAEWWLVAPSGAAITSSGSSSSSGGGSSSGSSGGGSSASGGGWS